MHIWGKLYKTKTKVSEIGPSTNRDPQETITFQRWATTRMPRSIGEGFNTPSQQRGMKGTINPPRVLDQKPSWGCLPRDFHVIMWLLTNHRWDRPKKQYTRWRKFARDGPSIPPPAKKKSSKRVQNTRVYVHACMQCPGRCGHFGCQSKAVAWDIDLQVPIPRSVGWDSELNKTYQFFNSTSWEKVRVIESIGSQWNTVWSSDS